MRPLSPLLLTLLIIAFLFTHCRQTDHQGALRFTPAAIPSFVADIDITRDTVLYAPGGTRLHIPAHALDAGGATHAKLVIQEALRMSDIIRAGLVTTANGQPLSSGGMIDIEPAAGQTLRIIKPIGVSLPSPYLQKNMQLYKGVPDEQGNINWTQPQPLADTSRLVAIEQGRQLFINNCASCHRLDREGTGPALAHITALRDKKWLYSFTRNNQAVMASGDPYAIYVYFKYGSTLMPVYPALSDQALDALYTYIDNESNRLGLPLPANDDKKCVDSCIARFRRQNKQPARGVVISFADGTNRKLTMGLNTGSRGDTSLIADTIPLSAREVLSYKFSVKTFGWYNIDILMGETDGVKESRLIVQPKGRYTQGISVSLIIPSLKIFHEGNLVENSSDSYCFHSSDGTILLPQGVKAFILVMGDADGRPVFALQPFMTATNLRLQPEPVIMSKEDIRAKLNTLDWTAPAEETPLAADTIHTGTISADTTHKALPGAKDTARATSAGCDCRVFDIKK